MFKFYLIHVAIATICLVNAESTYKTFKVIHAPNHDVETGNINDNYTNKMGVRMQGSDEIYLLNNVKSPDSLIHIGTVPLPPLPYQYVILNRNNKLIEAEPFYRPSMVDSETLYEFYGRRDTTKQTAGQKLPRVTYRYKNNKKDPRYSEGLDRSLTHPNFEIPTFHIQADQADLNLLREKVLEDIGIITNVTRISSNRVEKFDNVKIELSGQTSRLFKKLSYSINIDKKSKNTMNGYRRFKLRSCATDPSYLREKLVYDVLEASQLPSAKASFIRLFINEEPQGLYLLTDHYKNPFIENVLGNGNKKYKNGALYQGDMQENPLAIGQLRLGANLAYLGPHPKLYVEPETNTSVYKIQEEADGLKGKDPLNDLVEFIEFINKTEKYNLQDKKDERKLVNAWNKKFDVSLFLKHMAFEIIMGHNDGYMGAAHNYMMYKDPSQKGKFIWIASDLDQTLGNTLVLPRLRTAHTPMEKLDQFGLLDKMDSRPLVTQLLQVKEFNDRFYQIFADIHRSLFKTKSIVAHLFYLKDLIKEDVTWDQHIEKYRRDNFRSNRTVYENQLNQKVLQLPLGYDFMSRINKIDFETAIEGSINTHRSISSLVDWYKETSENLDEFVFLSNTNV